MSQERRQLTRRLWSKGLWLLLQRRSLAKPRCEFLNSRSCHAFERLQGSAGTDLDPSLVLFFASRRFLPWHYPVIEMFKNCLKLSRDCVNNFTLSRVRRDPFRFIASSLGLCDFINCRVRWKSSFFRPQRRQPPHARIQGYRRRILQSDADGAKQGDLTFFGPSSLAVADNLPDLASNVASLMMPARKGNLSVGAALADIVDKDACAAGS